MSQVARAATSAAGTRTALNKTRSISNFRNTFAPRKPPIAIDRSWQTAAASLAEDRFVWANPESSTNRTAHQRFIPNLLKHRGWRAASRHVSKRQSSSLQSRERGGQLRLLGERQKRQVHVDLSAKRPQHQWQMSGDHDSHRRAEHGRHEIHDLDLLTVFLESACSEAVLRDRLLPGADRAVPS